VINRFDLATISDSDRRRLLRRSQTGIDDLVEKVRPIVDAVRLRGDEAVAESTAAFDGVAVAPADFRVRPEEIEGAHRTLDPRVGQAIREAIGHVRAVHERQLPPERTFLEEILPGVLAGEKITPITSVGLYVPRGKGSFPSVMYMLATPAAIAGVPRIVVCTPPEGAGMIAAAAELLGIEEIWAIGGAQAIGFLAYVEQVHKIVGPGNAWVNDAKLEVSRDVPIDLPGGHGPRKRLRGRRQTSSLRNGRRRPSGRAQRGDHPRG